MEHDLELFIPILEILETEVFNIIYRPGNIGNLSFSTSSHPGNIGHLSFSTSGNIGKRIFSTSSDPGNIWSYDPYPVLSWKYWIVRSRLSPILEIEDRTILSPRNVENLFNGGPGRQAGGGAIGGSRGRSPSSGSAKALLLKLQLQQGLCCDSNTSC